MGFRVGIDIGNTFTDAIAIDERGNIVVTKSPTTPEDLKNGIMNCLDLLARRHDTDIRTFIKNIDIIIHGTTHGTNVLSSRSGPRMGIIATKGHSDTIQLRRVRKDNMWNWRLPFPQPLVPRWLRVGIDERLDSEGNILHPLDEESVHRAVAYLKKMKVESIVVTLLFSFLNQIHEKRVKEIIEKDFPGIHVTLSSEVASIPGEYERFTTAVVDAYTRPAIIEYTTSLKEKLNEHYFMGRLYFIQNNGGIETAEVVSHKPSTLAISGPAAGPSAAVTLGDLMEDKNLLSTDMGGTGFNISIIDNGDFMTRNESVISDHRFSLDIIDVESLGAGGSSIAWFDLGGTLRVGPQNSGSYPGPACYDHGGDEATLTDAVVALGYIDSDSPFGGNMGLKRELAERVIKEKIADKLGISVYDAANAIYKVFNSLMASGISHAFITKGYNPGDFVYCAGGAAGPVCALKIAEELDMDKIIIPKTAPVYTAFGMLNVDVKHHFSRHYSSVVADYDINKVRSLYKEMEADGTLLLEKDGVPEDQRSFTRILRMRYYGQFREIEVTWPAGPITEETIAQGVSNFHRRHKELFGSSNENYPLQFITFGLVAIGKISKASINRVPEGTKDISEALKGERDVYFDETKGFTTTRIYDGKRLFPGSMIEGPCIVEEESTTIVIPPNFKMRIDDYGNYVTM